MSTLRWKRKDEELNYQDKLDSSHFVKKKSVHNHVKMNKNKKVVSHSNINSCLCHDLLILLKSHIHCQNCGHNNFKFSSRNNQKSSKIQSKSSSNKPKINHLKSSEKTNSNLERKAKSPEMTNSNLKEKLKVLKRQIQI